MKDIPIISKPRPYTRRPTSDEAFSLGHEPAIKSLLFPIMAGFVASSIGTVCSVFLFVLFPYKSIYILFSILPIWFTFFAMIHANEAHGHALISILGIVFSIVIQINIPFGLVLYYHGSYNWQKVYLSFLMHLWNDPMSFFVDCSFLVFFTRVLSLCATLFFAYKAASREAALFFKPSKYRSKTILDW